MEDSIKTHVTTNLHDANCEQHVSRGAPFILAPVLMNVQDDVSENQNKQAERTQK